MTVCRMRVTTFKSQTEMTKSIVTYFVGVCLMSSSMYAVTNLQSSLNIKGGLGVVSLATWGSSLVVSSMCAIPILLKFFSARMVLVLSDIWSLMYVLANFYPAYFTMLPASLLFGLGRATFWPSASLFNVFFANNYVAEKGGSFSTYFSYINGGFFAAFVAGQIFGNVIPVIIFKCASFGTDDENSTTPTTERWTYNLISSTAFPQRFSVKDICGAKDCQDPDVASSDISNYQPPNKETLNLILGVLTLILLTAIFLHATFLPFFQDTNPPVVDSKRNDKGVRNKAYVFDKSETSLEENTEDAYNNNRKVAEIHEPKHVGKHSSPTNIPGTTFHVERQPIFASYLKKVKSFFKFFIKPQQLLLATLSLHVGVNQAFVMSEVTRAYISCVYGIEQIGIAMSIYGTSLLVSSVLVGRMSAIFGRKACSIVACLINTVVYLFCLLWIPSENSSILIIYALVILCGICDATIQIITSEASIIHFPNNTKQATACWVMWSSWGFVLQFSWSTSLCVKYKLYAMLFILYFGVGTYGFAEYRLSRRQRQSLKTENITTVA